MILFCLFLLFGVIQGEEETFGVWGLTYQYDEKCIDDVQVALKVNGDCHLMQGYKPGSSKIGCDKNNVTIRIYGDHDLQCSDYEGEMVNFPNIDFSIPQFTNESDVGSATNPIVEDMYMPLKHCMRYNGLLFNNKYRLSTECNSDGDGEIKGYESKACIFPKFTLKMKPGQVLDVSDFVESEGKAYFKFNGCSTK